MLHSFYVPQVSNPREHSADHMLMHQAAIEAANMHATRQGGLNHALVIVVICYLNAGRLHA